MAGFLQGIFGTGHCGGFRASALCLMGLEDISGK